MLRAKLTVTAGAMFLSGGTALALPFDASLVSGTTTLRVDRSSQEPPLIQSMSIVFPQTFADSIDWPFTGVSAGIDYQLGAAGEGVVFHVGSFAEGVDYTSARSQFDVTFTTDIDTIFSFTAVSASTYFEATLDGIVAKRSYDRFVGWAGTTFPLHASDPVWSPPGDSFYRTGQLPAGTYILTVDTIGSPYRGRGVDRSEGEVTLTLNPVPEITTALLGLMGLASLTMWRRHSA